jgi:hypothetical protein
MVALQRIGMHRVILLATLVTAACSSPSKSDVGRYDLACDTIDMEGVSVFRCARVDSRKGIVTSIDLDKVAETDGLGYAHAAEIGRYEIRCNSTAVQHEGEFRCVRLDTADGTVQYVKFP